RRSGAADAEDLPVLAAGGPLQRDGALGGGALDRRAEHRLRVGQRDADDEVAAAPLVDARRGHLREHVEGAGRAATVAGLPLALELDPRAVLDARGDLHLEPARAPLAAGAGAVLARLLDHGAVAAAARARLLEREQALVLGADAAAVALGADARLRAGLRARAVANVAGGFEVRRESRSE